MDIELRHLRAFLVLCEEANYTRAAARLHMSQPALTRTVQQLERLVECRLVERTSRRFGLTDAGATLLEHARRIVADIDSVRAELLRRSAVEIGFAWLLPDAWFAAVRERYEARGGRLRPRRVEDPIAALDARTIDIAVYRRHIRLPSRFASRVIATERRVLAVSASSALATGDPRTWAGLAHWPLVVNTVSGTTDAASWPESDPVREVVTCTNFDEWLELVAAGRGIGVVPELARTRAPHPGIVYRDIPDAPPSRVLLAWRAKPEPPRPVRDFLGVVDAVCAG